MCGFGCGGFQPSSLCIQEKKESSELSQISNEGGGCIFEVVERGLNLNGCDVVCRDESSKLSVVKQAKRWTPALRVSNDNDFDFVVFFSMGCYRSSTTT